MKEIPGYEGKYAVDEEGNVFSLLRGRKKLLKVRTKHDGRHYLYLGRHNEHQICHLVLVTYVGERPAGTVACHNNGVRDDNRLENLRWDTQANNHLDAVKHGTHPGFKNGRLTEESIENMKQLYKQGFSQICIAEVYNIAQTTVSKVVRGKNQRRFQGVH